MDQNEQLALARARQNAAQEAADVRARESADQQAHVRLSHEVMERARVVAAELARRGHPNIQELHYFEESKSRFRRKAERRIGAGWRFYSLGDGGDRWYATTITLLSTGKLIVAAGTPVTLGPNDVFLTPRHAEGVLRALNALIGK